jgi:hypothetical protein
METGDSLGVKVKQLEAHQALQNSAKVTNVGAIPPLPIRLRNIVLN